VYEHYESVYSRNRFAVWLWIFESKGWVRFDKRWKVTKEPTENDLNEVSRAYLQKHGNYDTPDDTCLNDLRKREPGSEKVRTLKADNVIPTVKDQTAMSWPEMKQAYMRRSGLRTSMMSPRSPQRQHKHLRAKPTGSTGTKFSTAYVTSFSTRKTR
jgi:hypothetical protein